MFNFPPYIQLKILMWQLTVCVSDGFNSTRKKTKPSDLKSKQIIKTNLKKFKPNNRKGVG
jgi:hypothetical protein